ncbi:MAG: hypothetical protein CVU90_06800 [Firmicutes bacterium HGW-Firmicutes-15]|nr:MAG: hypothetical protein CVU90_06800 [Firmicutes bacterium HGW-Firmicutes-15]
MNNPKKNRYLLLWALLALTLILSYSGIQLRVTNESHNNAVITTIDYKEFAKSANSANIDLDKILLRLQDSGVKNVAVNELTLRDLAYNGDIYISSYGDFASLTRTLSPQIWADAMKAIGSTPISPSNLAVVTGDPAVAAFLKERLGSRFLPNELISFTLAGKSYFIINSQLSPINIELNPADKNKAVSKDLDARLGFDEKVLKQLKASGFNIILRPGNNLGSNTQYLAEYERAVADYGVKYLIFAGNDLSGAPNHLEWVENLVKKHGLIVGIIETSAQLQYVTQNGLDELMQSAGYPINRVYSTSNDEFVQDIDERYYRWVRGVIDRGIRIMYVVPFKDQKVSFSKNLDNTVDTIGKFHATIAEKGYSIDQPLQLLSAKIPGQTHRLLVALSLLLAGTLYLLYLFRPRLKPVWLASWLVLGTLICIAINIVLSADFSKLYALAAAILYPSFSSLVLLLYLKKNREKPFLLQLMVSLAIILGINSLGMYTVVTSLADIRYIMNVYIFSGVKMAFILPLLLFFVNYVSCMVGFTDFKNNTIQFLQDKPSYLVLLMGMVGVLAIYYYLGRSGNAVVSVSSLEIRLREILESLFLARPRFKELLIGYPSLFAMVYLYRKYQYDAILLVLGLGVMMGSISMVNSFSHVFTTVMVSANRTLAGLLTGTVVGLVGLLVIWAGEWVVGRYSSQIR